WIVHTSRLVYPNRACAHLPQPVERSEQPPERVVRVGVTLLQFAPFVVLSQSYPVVLGFQPDDTHDSFGAVMLELQHVTLVQTHDEPTARRGGGNCSLVGREHRDGLADPAPRRVFENVDMVVFARDVRLVGTG